MNELSICLVTEIGMIVNLLIYCSALTYIMIRHNDMLSCVTKVLEKEKSAILQNMKIWILDTFFAITRNGHDGGKSELNGAEKILGFETKQGEVFGPD